MSVYLDFHALQSVPPSNINRDDTGSPKTAVYGGVRRARVSSQSWKRAIRKDFETYLDPSELGVRSKRLVELIVTRVEQLAPDLAEQAEALVTAVLAAIDIKIEKPKRGKADEGADEPVGESGYLIFLSNQQLERLAEYTVSVARSGGKPVKKEVAVQANLGHSFDIALFGRMVADLTDLRVDAAAQVAHAISVHGVENEFDYFTAVDDNAAGDHAGAGMIGNIEFNSSTLYRYATVNVTQLNEHLGDPAGTLRAVEAFARSFIRSMPTGKQNTFANRTLPQAVVVSLRVDQPVNLVGAFEASIDGPSRLKQAALALAEHSQALSAAYNAGPEATWVLRVSDDAAALDELGERVDLDSLVTQAAQAATDRLQA